MQNSFMVNIRAYNSMFSMTSFGATVDDFLNQGGSPYIIKIAWQISQWVGSLCPQVGDRPRFLQMYNYDPKNEVSNRPSFFSSFQVVRAGLRRVLL